MRSRTGGRGWWACLLVIVGTLLNPGYSRADDAPAASPKLKQPTIPDSVQGELRAINQRLSKDLNPADNAVVDLVQLFGDSVFEPELREASLEMLGIEQLGSPAPKVVYIEEFLSSPKRGLRAKEIPAAAKELNLELAYGSGALWTRDKAKRLAAYMAANEPAINAIVKLTKKPRYYAPLLTVEQPPRLLSASVVIERRLPYLGHLLAARAMNRLATDDFAGAMADLLAGHRLAELLAQGSPFDLSMAQASKVVAVMHAAESTMLESGKLSGAQAREYLAALQKLPPLRHAARCADIGERAILHQELEFVQSSPDDIRDLFPLPEGDETEKDGKKDAGKEKERALPDIKWDLALKRADAIQDLIVAALQTRDRPQQLKKFEEIEQLYENWRKTADETTLKLAKAEKPDIDAMSAWVGENMAFSLFPQIRQRRATEDRTTVRRELLMVGLALIAYRADAGTYPDELAALVPKYLTELPANESAGDMFLYRRGDMGQIELVSKGVNQQDDAGQSYSDDMFLKLK